MGCFCAGGNIMRFDSNRVAWSLRDAYYERIHSNKCGTKGMHFFDENRRVEMQVRALKNDNFAAF